MFALAPRLDSDFTESAFLQEVTERLVDAEEVTT